MNTRRLWVAPLVLVGMLSGCAVPAPAASPNPVSDLISLIPWAKSVAGDATAQELTSRIAEVTAGLSSLDIPEADRGALQARLTALGAAIAADPTDAATHAAELNSILDDIRAAS